MIRRMTSKTTHLTTREHHATTAMGHKFMLVPNTLRSTPRMKLKTIPKLQMRHEISADRQQMRSMTNYIKAQLKSNPDPVSISKTPIITLITIKTPCNSPSSTRLNPFRTPNYTIFNRVVPKISLFNLYSVTRNQVSMKKNYELFKSLNKSQMTNNKRPRMFLHSSNNG